MQTRGGGPKTSAILVLCATCSLSMAADDPTVSQQTEPADPPPAATRRSDDWLVGEIDTRGWWVTAGLALGLGAYYATADVEDIRDLGDLTQALPGVFALTAILTTRDYRGLKQLGFVAGTTVLTTHGLKQLVDKSRPDESANTSFPSATPRLR